MSKQRYIRDSFWTDPYVENLDPTEKLLFLYFLTNPLCNVAGIYEIRDKRVAYETGIDKDMVDKIKNRFKDDGKMLFVDDWIVISNFGKNQSPNPNVIKGMQRIIDDLPEKVKALKGFERLPYFTLLNLTIPNLTLPNEETPKEVVVVDTGFDNFWSIYPKKVDKKKSQLKWNRLKESEKSIIMQDIPNRLENDDKWIKGYAPNPTTYLNGERWNDEITSTRTSLKKIYVAE